MGDASENPAPPKKRRRRWLLAPVLFLLATLVWWYYPRGDGRLVGHWQFQETRLRTVSSLLNLGQPTPLFQIDLRSNGLAILRSVSSPRNGAPRLSPPLYTRWKLEGDDLIIGNPDGRFVNGYVTSFAKLLSRYFSITLMTNGGFRMRVVAVDSNRIDLEPPGSSVGLPFNPNLLSPIHYALTRLPE